MKVMWLVTNNYITFPLRHMFIVYESYETANIHEMYLSNLNI